MNLEDHGGRIETHGGGTGEISDSMIQRRAQELALQEGRDTTRADDLARARRELLGESSPYQADDDANDPLSAMHPPDDPAGSGGHRTERYSSLEESSAAERLVQEGLDEAEHELMTEAEREQRRQAS